MQIINIKSINKLAKKEKIEHPDSRPQGRVHLPPSRRRKSPVPEPNRCPLQKKINANRRNAEKSTGPRTPEGKQKSAANSRTHGLTASTIDSFSPEWRTQFLAFRDEIWTELAPASLTEELAANEYAFAQFLYTKALANEIRTLEAWNRLPEDPLTFAAYRTATRYVQSIARRAKVALKELHRLQVNRHLAAEVEAIAQIELETTIQVPVATPLSDLFPKRSLAIDPSDFALRHALAQRNPDPSPPMSIP